MNKEQSLLLKVNGDIEEISPSNGKNFTLEELYKLINTDIIETIQTKDKRLIIVDEEGKLKKRGFNLKATTLANLNYLDFIVGDVVVCPKKFFR